MIILCVCTNCVYNEKGVCFNPKYIEIDGDGECKTYEERPYEEKTYESIDFNGFWKEI